MDIYQPQPRCHQGKPSYNRRYFSSIPFTNSGIAKHIFSTKYLANFTPGVLGDSPNRARYYPFESRFLWAYFPFCCVVFFANTSSIHFKKRLAEPKNLLHRNCPALKQIRNRMIFSAEEDDVLYVHR